jgi:hypothetical protein
MNYALRLGASCRKDFMMLIGLLFIARRIRTSRSIWREPFGLTIQQPADPSEYRTQVSDGVSSNVAMASQGQAVAAIVHPADPRLPGTDQLLVG